MKEKNQKINYKQIIENIKPKMEEEIASFEEDLKKIRTQRVNASLIEDLKVVIFNQPYQIRQLGTISQKNPRILFFQPWDNSYLEPILEELTKSSLQVSARAVSGGIEISFPPLSEEFRQNLIKLVSQKKEILRRKIRNLREKAWNDIQKGFYEKKLSEDEKYKAKEALQDLVDDLSDKIENLVKNKIEELKE